jgi:V8-like Glu-specific endopeptidase
VRNRWCGRNIRRATLALLLMLLASPLSPFRASGASAAVDLSTLIEDYSYAGAAVPANLDGLELMGGDGNFRLVTCPPGNPITDDLIRVTYLHDNIGDACFKVTGPTGLIRLKVPRAYKIERNRTHLITATLQRLDNGAVYSQRIIADNGRNCRPALEPCFVAVGEGTGTPGTDENAADLLEMAASPLGGPDAPAALPAPETNPSVGRLTVGVPGRTGSTSCTATLVDPAWVLSSASCFGTGLTAGAPPQAAKVFIGGQAARNVVSVEPRTDRDVVLARVDQPIAGVFGKLASTAPTNGQALTVAGFGRTASEWVPTKVHTTAATVSSVSGLAVNVTSNGPVCKGDAGAPVLNEAGEVVAVTTGSGQQGCLGATDTTAGAVAVGIADISSWIRDRSESRKDISVFYDYGNKGSGLLTFDSTGTGFTPPTGTAWASCTGCWEWSRSKVVSGDFTGDGKDDIAVFYDYGNTSGLWTFAGTGTGFAAPTQAWMSAPNAWEWSRSKIVAGDLTGDGKDDIGVFYDYGNGTSGILTFTSTGTGFTAPTGTSWTSCNGCWEWARSKIVAGDFNGDGKDDIGVFYDYGNNTSGLMTFTSTGTGFTTPATTPWMSCQGCWGWSGSKVVAGDFTGDGKDDIGVFYDAGNNTSGLMTFTSTGTGFTTPATTPWMSCQGCWDWSGSKVVAGDFTGDGKDDIGVFYDYGNNTSGILTFSSTGTGFTAPTGTSWMSATGSWTWSASTVV